MNQIPGVPCAGLRGRLRFFSSLIYIGDSSPLGQPFNRRLAALFAIHVYDGNPFEIPCCRGTMKPVRKVIRREEIEFFLRIHGLWGRRESSHSRARRLLPSTSKNSEGL